MTKMAKITELTREQLGTLTPEQKKWLLEDYIKANQDDIMAILKKTDIPDKLKKEMVDSIEVENEGYQKQIDDLRAKLLEADKKLTTIKVPLSSSSPTIYKPASMPKKRRRRL